MSSVLWKNGCWYARLKGHKTPGKWAAYSTGLRAPEDRAEAERQAEEKQRAVDARLQREGIENRSIEPRPKKKLPRARLDTEGMIYALRLLPDLAPNRIKVGFTSSSLKLRIAQHRVTCPMLEILATWRGKRIDENKAHAVLSGRLMLSEIFDVPNVDAALSAISGVLGEAA